MKQQIISLLERAKENGTTIGDVLAEARGFPDGWQSIETAPKDGAEIWGFNGEQARMLWSEGEHWALWVWADSSLADIDPSPDQPTHWMPIPAAPGADSPTSRPATPAASAEPVGNQIGYIKIGVDGCPRAQLTTAFGQDGKVWPDNTAIYAAPPAAAERAPVADERAAFEAWMESQGFALLRDGDSYSLTYARRAWAAWQERGRRAAVASAPVAGEAQPVIHQHGFAADNQRLRAINESLDKQLEEVMTERDEYHDMADKLADAIADHLLVEIGEHSSSNCPWMRALEAIESAAPQASPAADGRDAKDAARYRWLRSLESFREHDDWTIYDGGGSAARGEALDAAIDATIAAQQDEGGGV